MVFTTAAADPDRAIVVLAFETIERIIREHFVHITETDSTTFTDCVNCLIAFTNSDCSPDVSLNAIAFLRFCALKLAEGAIGNLDEAARREGEGGEEGEGSNGVSTNGGGAVVKSPARQRSGGHPPVQGVTCFTDADVHVYFWFPLLAGLSELTFDPRPEIRRSALEVLFDTLKFHGGSFTSSFWRGPLTTVTCFPLASSAVLLSMCV